jgi:hypothetical protein
LLRSCFKGEHSHFFSFLVCSIEYVSKQWKDNKQKNSFCGVSKENASGDKVRSSAKQFCLSIIIAESEPSQDDAALLGLGALLNHD